ncbi:MAG: mechanosensitive ion channel family protein [Caldimicrobium sp.]
MNWKEILLLLGVFIGIIFATYVLRSVVFRYLLRLAKKTKWPWDDVVIKILKGFIPFWGLLLAIHVSLSLTKLPPNIFSIVNKALLILFIISLAVSGSRLIIKIFDIYVIEKTETLSKVTLFEIFVKILVYAIAFILILNVLNINIAPFITTLGIAGLAVSLALKDTLENFFAGLQLLMSKQIKPGDFIRLESGEEGFVEDITWRNTTIRMLPNNLIIIPNSKLAQSMVINYHLPSLDLAVLVQVGVSYDSDLEKVERVTIEVARELMQTHPEGVPDFEPFIRYNSFGDFSINFTVILRAKDPTSRFVIAHEFIKRLHKRYKEEGIEIPFPIRTVYLYQKGEKPKA